MILAVSVFALVSAFRARFANGVRSQIAYAENSVIDDKLRIFAATFNNANADSKDYSEKQTNELLRALTDEHEDPGEEADLVILGFQEFKDRRAKLGMEAKTSHVWQKLSEKKMKQVEQEINNVVKIPEHVLETKVTILNEFNTFHAKLGDQLEAFRKEFGKSSKQFHEHIADNSKLTSWEDEHMTGELYSSLKTRENEQSLADKQAIEKQYHEFNVGADKFKKMTKAHPKAEWIREAMKPIHAWTGSTLEEITKIRNRYPNMNYTEVGESAWNDLVVALDRAKNLEHGLIQNNNKKTKLQTDMDDFLSDVKQAVGAHEKTISSRLYNDLTAIKQAVATLKKDLMNLVQNETKDRDISSKAGRAARGWEHELNTSVSSWEQSNGEIFQKLLHQPSFQISANHHEVTMKVHKFQSPTRCQLMKHYDTILYVYVNPWSEWKISPISYTSPTCEAGASGSTNMGCSIDNSRDMECGKAVNIMKFQAQKGSKSINFCALNTHMSYAGEASERMQYIKEAVKEAIEAKCDTLVFVGDFNSRMHCDLTTASIPPYDRLDTKTNSSFRYIVDNVCPDGTCTLKNLDENIIYYDELMQMMDKNSINCMEKRKIKVNPRSFRRKMVWQNIEMKNELVGLNLFEAGVPDWAPTYKVAPASEAEQLPEGLYFCAEGEAPGREQSCFMNTDGKGKHNPAWTDRILVWPSKGGKAIPEVTAYKRRSVDPALGSDHVPVVSKVTVTVTSSKSGS